MYDKIPWIPLLFLVQGDIIKIKNGHLSNLLKKTRLGSHHSEKMEFLRQIQRKKPIYAIGSFNQHSQAKATLTRPLKGLVRSPPWGDITVDPKGVAKLLDELHVLFFLLQNSKTALPGEMIKFWSCQYYKKEKNPGTPMFLKCCKLKIYWCYLYILVIRAVIWLKGGPCRESMHE